MLIINILLLGGCDLIEYHPYDVRVKGETNVNANNIAQIEANCKDKSSIRFAVMGDSQRWYDETEVFVKAINFRDDIDFVIHGGDISDFGLTKEFMWQRDIMNNLNVPYVVIIGNHDCLGTGEEAYKTIFGDTNFSFIAGRVKFVCLNTNALEYDYSSPIPDFDFIESEMSNRKEDFDKTIFSMHGAPLCDVFNNNVAKVFQRYITEYPKLQFCTIAHNHYISVTDIFDDGVLYYGSTCMKDRSFLLFTITPEGYEYEAVYY
ncbi:MAG TPA: phosphoesterase [Porphyromonadaceae bacterium]|nr:phosphoesterase [Porphyromonadaceae bacterium]